MAFLCKEREEEEPTRQIFVSHNYTQSKENINKESFFFLNWNVEMLKYREIKRNEKINLPRVDPNPSKKIARVMLLRNARRMRNA